MTEDNVIVIADNRIDRHEEAVGKPRHESNTKKFDLLFECMTEAVGTLNKIKGGLIFGGFIFGLPAFVASILVIVKFARGH